MTKYWADKPILRDFFWFLVLPYKLRQNIERATKPESEQV